MGGFEAGRGRLGTVVHGMHRRGRVWLGTESRPVAAGMVRQHKAGDGKTGRGGTGHGLAGVPRYVEVWGRGRPGSAGQAELGQAWSERMARLVMAGQACPVQVCRCGVRRGRQGKARSRVGQGGMAWQARRSWYVSLGAAWRCVAGKAGLHMDA
jgi:hypothetical protein